MPEKTQDSFEIEQAGDHGVNIEIFNRWGKKIYASPAYKNDWNADGVAGGVYYYALSVPCFGEKKGILHVLK